jgi:hypothetical protein
LLFLERGGGETYRQKGRDIERETTEIDKQKDRERQRGRERQRDRETAREREKKLWSNLW